MTAEAVSRTFRALRKQERSFAGWGMFRVCVPEEVIFGFQDLGDQGGEYVSAFVVDGEYFEVRLPVGCGSKARLAADEAALEQHGVDVDSIEY